MDAGRAPYRLQRRRGPRRVLHSGSGEETQGRCRGDRQLPARHRRAARTVPHAAPREGQLRGGETKKTQSRKRQQRDPELWFQSCYPSSSGAEPSGGHRGALQGGGGADAAQEAGAAGRVGALQDAERSERLRGLDRREGAVAQQHGDPRETGGPGGRTTSVRREREESLYRIYEARKFIKKTHYKYMQYKRECVVVMFCPVK